LMVLIMVLVATVFTKLYYSEPHCLGADSLFGIREVKNGVIIYNYLALILILPQHQFIYLDMTLS
jgi:hypothetical protein